MLVVVCGSGWMVVAAIHGHGAGASLLFFHGLACVSFGGMAIIIEVGTPHPKLPPTHPHPLSHPHPHTHPHTHKTKKPKNQKTKKKTQFDLVQLAAQQDPALFEGEFRTTLA